MNVIAIVPDLFHDAMAIRLKIFAVQSEGEAFESGLVTAEGHHFDIAFEPLFKRAELGGYGFFGTEQAKVTIHAFTRALAGSGTGAKIEEIIGLLEKERAKRTQNGIKRGRQFLK